MGCCASDAHGARKESTPHASMPPPPLPPHLHYSHPNNQRHSHPQRSGRAAAAAEKGDAAAFPAMPTSSGGAAAAAQWRADGGQRRSAPPPVPADRRRRAADGPPPPPTPSRGVCSAAPPTPVGAPPPLPQFRQQQQYRPPPAAPVERRSAPPPRRAAAPVRRYAVGDRVDAVWLQDGCYYAAWITETRASPTDTCRIVFDDGVEEYRQPLGSCRPRFVTGDRVDVRWQEGQHWYRGWVDSVVGNGLYAVRYDDGDFEPRARAEMMRPAVDPAAMTKGPLPPPGTVFMALSRNRRSHHQQQQQQQVSYHRGHSYADRSRHPPPYHAGASGHSPPRAMRA